MLIVDTDGGYDDFLAILYLLATKHPIEAFTTVTGVSGAKESALALLRMLELLKLDIPVYVGEDTPASQTHKLPDEWRHQAVKMKWGGPTTLKPQPQSAPAFLAQLPGSIVSILALGPLSNIPFALETGAPRVLLVMGGTIKAEGLLPEVKPVAEPNFYVDPNAAQAVSQFMVHSSLRAVLVPLDACNHVPIDDNFITQFAQQTKPETSAPYAKLAREILDRIGDEFLHPLPPNRPTKYFAYDPLAAVALRTPAVLLMPPNSAGVLSVDPNSGQSSWQEQAGAGLKAALGADPKLFRETFIAGFA